MSTAVVIERMFIRPPRPASMVHDHRGRTTKALFFELVEIDLKRLLAIVMDLVPTSWEN